MEHARSGKSDAFLFSRSTFVSSEEGAILLLPLTGHVFFLIWTTKSLVMHNDHGFSMVTEFHNISLYHDNFKVL